ncbi:exonuclease domain-containing protein [Kaistia defluvii]|uniref:DNA polymerase III epsilon subunit-like protein n=1 Tax=Kaistia defluvii TaxID=410841 RepID=A0ABV2R1W1_9HYPH
MPSIEESLFAAVALSSARVAPFPQGPFRFFALDVETANNHRGSICQIGVACVRPDNSIETWVTLVNPQTRIWLWSGLHGITAERVEGAPTFADVLPVLEVALRGHTVYQHSGFDRSAVAAACADIDLVAPAWLWHNSVQVARAAWPELKGNGGHGLASLKAHLGLRFNHHDAGEDARAAAEVVLHAEGVRAKASSTASRGDLGRSPSTPSRLSISAQLEAIESQQRHIGVSQLTEGNLKHKHIYLKDFFDRFPADAIGGSNMAEAASREIRIHWGGGVIATDLDGSKKLFRKRAWVSAFFDTSGAQAGDWVSISEIGPYSYRISCHPTDTID